MQTQIKRSEMRKLTMSSLFRLHTKDLLAPPEKRASTDPKTTQTITTQTSFQPPPRPGRHAEKRTRNPACLLQTQGSLRNFPKHKPNNKMDKQILKRHADKWPKTPGESEEEREDLQGHQVLECSSGKEADGTPRPSVSLTPLKSPSHSINWLKC